MRFARYRDAGGRAHLALAEAGALYALEGPGDLLALLSEPDALAVAGRRARNRPEEVVAIDEAELLAPIASPPTVRDFYAFEAHVLAGRRWRGLPMQSEWYDRPAFYFSNPYAVRGPGDVPLPPDTEAFDYELEVAAVLGGGGRDVPVHQAEGLIAGYTVMNDWSSRDVQAREMKLSLGPVKGKDCHTGLGPILVTPDEIEGFRRGEGFDLAMTATVNGIPSSAAQWSDVHFSFAEMIAYASRGSEVRPGDVLGSGTCGTGCLMELRQAHGEAEHPWLAAGDVVVCEIEHLGAHRATVTP